jgi:predicted aconitase
MFHIEGITPEAPTKAVALQGREIEETWVFTQEDLEKAYRPWREYDGAPVDYVYIGCPHASIFDLQQITENLDGRRIADSLEFWIGTNRAIRGQAESLGLIEKIEASGAKVLADCCMKANRYKTRTRDRVMTSGAKVMWYWRSPQEDPEFGSQRLLGTIEECVETAVAGVFKPDLNRKGLYVPKPSQ